MTTKWKQVCTEMRKDLINQKSLILRLARHVRNTDEIPLPTWAGNGMRFLEEIMGLFPEDYDREVKLPKRTMLRREDWSALDKNIIAVASPRLRPLIRNESAYTHQKNRQEKQYTSKGSYDEAHRAWTPKQLDNLLTYFLDDAYPMLAGEGKKSLVLLCGRPVKAIQKALWRLGVRDLKRSRFANYHPRWSRPKRTGEAFTTRDDFLIMLAFSDAGRENAACTNNWIRLILNRQIDEVEDHIENLWQRANKKPTLRKPSRFDWVSMSNQTILFKFLKRRQSRNVKDFGDE